MALQRILPYTVLILVTFFFSSNVVLGKYLAPSLSPAAIAFWRWTFALLAALIAVWISGPKITLVQLKAASRNFPFLLSMGFLGMSFCGTVVYYAAHFTSASNIGLVYASSPVFVALISIFLGLEKNRWGTWIGFTLALVGVLEVMSRGNTRDMVEHWSMNTGDFLVLTSAMAWAIYSIFSRKKIAEVSEPLKFILFCCLGVLALVPFLLWAPLELAVVPVHLKTWLLLLFMGLVPSFLAFKGYEWVGQKLGLIAASTILLITPLSNSVLAMVVLDESIEAYHIWGGLLIVLGVALILYGRVMRS